MAVGSTTSTASTTSTSTTSNRVGGLVSGMDIDTLVAKLTLGSKNKIIKEQQKSQKLQWKQDAYRKVTAAIIGFKKSYFDALSTTNLRSTSFFNPFKASSSSDAIKASATPTASPGTINVTEVSQLATNQKIDSSSNVSKALSGALTETGTLTESEISTLVSDLSGKSISINLDGKIRTISFDASFVATATSPVSADSFKLAFQNSLNATFGKDTSGNNLINVGITGNQFSLSASTSKIILGGDSATLLKLGFVPSQSNKITTSNSLASLSLNSALAGSSFEFKINDVDFSFTSSDSLDKVISTINSSTAGVTLSYSSLSDKLTLTSKETGSGENIKFSETTGNFLSSIMSGTGSSTQGKNAELKVDGVSISRSSNNFNLDGTNFELLKTFNSGSDPVAITVKADSASLFDPIVKFVGEYNNLMDTLNGYITEKTDSNYQPLTDEQKAAMTESQISVWETKAKAGILTGDSILSGLKSKLQAMIYEPGVTGGIALFSIGISSAGWQENGKLVIDETKLKDSLSTKGSDIKDLFTATNGLANKMNDLLAKAVETKGVQGTRGSLIEIAGIPLHTSATQNNITKYIESSKALIVTLNTRLTTEENRYWTKFSAMETAISKLNDQSTMITKQFSS
ncbi:MAG: flagellar filament capping protein FliD [Eubacteriales bacterium]